MVNQISIVTVGIIAYNEQQYLPDLLSDLLKQSYEKQKIEVILVDGNSSDDTLQIMITFQNTYKNEYKDIKVLNNPNRIQPCGWNIVIKNFTGDILIRVDAHARLPETFIMNNVTCINTGEFICGGPRENIIDKETQWKQMLLTAEQSMFGAGIAPYRQDTDEKKYIKSLFHGAYRKEVIDKVGLFNEKLIRTEDNEYHYRVYKAGYLICYDPNIHSYYQTRNSLKGMIRQKYQNGFWIGKTMFICPGCVSLYHLVPFAFILAIILSTLLCLTGFSWPAICLWIAYFTGNIGMSVVAIVNSRKKNMYLLLLPIVFSLLHIAYGIGTLRGLIHGKD